MFENYGWLWMIMADFWELLMIMDDYGSLLMRIIGIIMGIIIAYHYRDKYRW